MSKDRELLQKIVDTAMFQNDSFVEITGELLDEIQEHLKSTAKAEKEVTYPFPSTAFASAWQSWETHRKENRKKLTPSTRDRQLAKCKEWGEARSIAAINHSIEKGYQGLFEPSKPMIQQQTLVKARKDFGY